MIRKFSFLLTTIARVGHSVYNGSYGGGWKWDTATPTSCQLDFDNEKEAELAIKKLEEKSSDSLEYEIVRLWGKK